MKIHNSKFKIQICCVICWLMTATVVTAQGWSDAATLKRGLMQAALEGKSYFSQYDFYNPRKCGGADSDYVEALQCRPMIYGLDFHYASGTWYKPKSIRKARKNLINIVKSNWRERRAVASFSWHLENPYAPTGSPFEMAGYRYVDNGSIPDYPAEHRHVVKEIVENGGDRCGAWFEERCKEVAAIINELVDEKGKPIPIIFRLWHEWEDAWAWWGARYTSAEDYKRFFILTERTIMRYAPEAQILWAYCPDRHWDTEEALMSRYPGDGYVDIIGFDDYALGASEEDFQSAVERARIISKVAKERNLATALFETNNNRSKTSGFYTRWLNRLLKSDGVNLGIVQIWRLKNFNDSTDMRIFLNMDNIIIEKGLSNN